MAQANLKTAGPRIVPELIRLVEDSDGAVRLLAADSLTNYPAEARAAIPMLTAHLSDPSKPVRKACTNTLTVLTGLEPAMEK